MRPVRFALTTLVSSALVGPLVHPCCAQGAASPQATTTVVVAVQDSSGDPIADATISAISGLSTLLATGVTNEAGRHTLFVTTEPGSYQVVVQRIGFARADRFVATRGNDTVSLKFVMRRVTRLLAPVTVSTREDLVRRAYYIDADAIGATDRLLYNALDVVQKLRPDMISSLGGCSKIKEVFVNGERIVDAPTSAVLAAKARSVDLSAYGPVTKANAASVVHAMGLLKHAVPLGPASILTAIKPEHIAEMRYNDCREPFIKVNHGADALFIVLKPGVAYSAVRGSYVIGDSLSADSASSRGSAKRPSY